MKYLSFHPRPSFLYVDQSPYTGSHDFQPLQRPNSNSSLFYIINLFLLSWIIPSAFCYFLHLKSPNSFPLHPQTTTPFLCSFLQQNSLKELSILTVSNSLANQLHSGFHSDYSTKTASAKVSSDCHTAKSNESILSSHLT